jgi:hypothetical protein
LQSARLVVTSTNQHERIPDKTSLLTLHVRVLQTKNEGQVALEMGNSPKVVKDHYFEIVDEPAAREYWSIKPLSPEDRKLVAIA